MILLHDAWVISRLLGYELNGELARDSQTARPLANRLANLLPGERRPAWDDYVEAEPDGEAWITAVGRHRSQRPQPEATDES